MRNLIRPGEGSGWERAPCFSVRLLLCMHAVPATRPRRPPSKSAPLPLRFIAGRPATNQNCDAVEIHTLLGWTDGDGIAQTVRAVQVRTGQDIYPNGTIQNSVIDACSTRFPCQKPSTSSNAAAGRTSMRIQADPGHAHRQQGQAARTCKPSCGAVLIYYNAQSF
jgi:hypothetical protein